MRMDVMVIEMITSMLRIDDAELSPHWDISVEEPALSEQAEEIEIDSRAEIF